MRIVYSWEYRWERAYRCLAVQLMDAQEASMQASGSEVSENASVRKGREIDPSRMLLQLSNLQKPSRSNTMPWFCACQRRRPDHLDTLFH